MANSRATPTLVVTIVVFVLASVFVALRFVSRVGVVRKVVSHDYLILLAWVCSLTFCAILILTFLKAIDFGFVFAVCYGTTKGLGLHQQNVPFSSNTALNTSEYVANVLYVSLTSTLTKALTNLCLLEPRFDGPENVNPHILPLPVQNQQNLSMGDLRNNRRRQRRRYSPNNGQHLPMRPGQCSNLVPCQRRCEMFQHSRDIPLFSTRQSYNRYCDFLPATTDSDSIATSAEAENYIDHHVQFRVLYCGCGCYSSCILAECGDVECDRTNGWAW